MISAASRKLAVKESLFPECLIKLGESDFAFVRCLRRKRSLVSSSVTAIASVRSIAALQLGLVLPYFPWIVELIISKLRSPCAPQSSRVGMEKACENCAMGQFIV